MSTEPTTQATQGGHVFHGTLGAEDVRALFERCASMKFTGLLELTEAARRNTITFVGGEPLDGPDLFKLGAVWRRGSYRLIQRALDLTGSLADDISLSGSLGDAMAMDLFHHCEEYRLSADIEFACGDGQRAKVRFGKGLLESAEVNGQPNMAALVTIGGWKDGTYRLTVRPLFDGMTAPAPVAAPTPAKRAPAAPPPNLEATAKVPLWDVDQDEAEHTPPPVLTLQPPSSAAASTARPAERPSLLSRPSSGVAGSLGRTTGLGPSPLPRPAGAPAPRPGSVTETPAPFRLGNSPAIQRPAASARPATPIAPLGGSAPRGLPIAAKGPASPPAPSSTLTPPTAKPVGKPAAAPVDDVPFRTVRPSQRAPEAKPEMSLDPSTPPPPAVEPTVRMALPFGDPDASPPPTASTGALVVAPPVALARASDAPPVMAVPPAVAAPPAPTHGFGDVTAVTSLPTSGWGELHDEHEHEEVVRVAASPLAPAKPVSSAPEPEPLAPAPHAEAPRPAPTVEPDPYLSAESLPPPPSAPPAAAEPAPFFAPEEEEAAEPVFRRAAPPSPAEPPALKRPPSPPAAPPAAVLPLPDEPVFRRPDPTPPPRPLDPPPVQIAPTPPPLQPPPAPVAASSSWTPASSPSETTAIEQRIAEPPALRKKSSLLPVALGVAGAAVAVGIFAAILWPKAETPAPPNPVQPVVTPAPSVKPLGAQPGPGQPIAPAVPTVAPPQDEFQRRILEARKATIEGRKKDALKAFKAAFKLNPKDDAFSIYVPMATGKTGKSTIVLAGNGPIVIDGHTFIAPQKKLVVAAGPHRVESGGATAEVVVPKGKVQTLVAGVPPPAGAAVAPPPAVDEAVKPHGGKTGKVKNGGAKKVKRRRGRAR